MVSEETRLKMRRAKNLPFGQAARNQLLSDYKKKAAQRGLAWQVSDDDFDRLTKSRCRYCGVGPQCFAGYKHNNGLYNYNGIDRIDNTLGYVPGNIAPCCKLCNHMKWALGEQTFLMHIMRITMYSLPEIVAFEAIGISEDDIPKRIS